MYSTFTNNLETSAQTEAAAHRNFESLMIMMITRITLTIYDKDNNIDKNDSNRNIHILIHCN